MLSEFKESPLPRTSAHGTSPARFCDHQTARWVAGTLCLIAIISTLTAGLWPFHAPKNEVSWVKNEDALRFGRYGTALSLGPFVFPAAPTLGCSIEVWLEPALTWTTGSVLTFYDPSSGREFSLQQDLTDLVLLLDTQASAHPKRPQRLQVRNVFRRRQAFITITSDRGGTAVYIDGRLTNSSSDFALSSNYLSGQLILADAPLRGNSWSGQLRGLAIYGSQLSPEQVARQYADWTQSKEPLLTQSELPVATYRFDEHQGSVVHNAVPSQPDLEIPKKYFVLKQLSLEPPQQEIITEKNYLRDCIINVVGFIPLGFVCYLYLATLVKSNRATLAAIAAGAAVSLTIEFFQAYLPTRYSGMTDIITNALGSGVGAVLCRLGYRWAERIPALTRLARRDA